MPLAVQVLLLVRIHGSIGNFQVPDGVRHRRNRAGLPPALVSSATDSASGTQAATGTVTVTESATGSGDFKFELDSELYAVE